MKIVTRLNEIGFSITEFADYLNISRPTLYKYCEEFDKIQYAKIPPKILEVLKIIKRNKLIGKNYIIKLIIDINCTNFQDKEINIFNTIDNLGYLFSHSEKKFLSRYLNDSEFRKLIMKEFCEK